MTALGIARVLRWAELLGSPTNRIEPPIRAIIEKNIRGMSQKAARMTPGFRYSFAILV
jgi:hypothetical protein